MSRAATVPGMTTPTSSASSRPLALLKLLGRGAAALSTITGQRHAEPASPPEPSTTATPWWVEVPPSAATSGTGWSARRIVAEFVLDAAMAQSVIDDATAPAPQRQAAQTDLASGILSWQQCGPSAADLR